MAVVELLLSKGAAVEHSNVRGDTALSLAAYVGHEEVVRTLLSRNADVGAASRKNKFTALHLASFKGHLAVVRVLLDAKADIDALESMGKSGNSYLFLISCVK